MNAVTDSSKKRSIDVVSGDNDCNCDSNDGRDLIVHDSSRSRRAASHDDDNDDDHSASL